MPTPSNDLKARYEDVRSRIDAAAAKAGRRGDDIVLVAVTKNASIDVVRQLLALGRSMVHRPPREKNTQLFTPTVCVLTG